MKVLLTALSAKAIHKTLAPWCLKAYCDAHVPACEVIVQEHTINDHMGDIVTEIFQAAPDVVGFSCYIWNIEQVVKTAQMLKKYLPQCIIILGGPEVSFEADCSNYPFADYIIQGAGEAALAGLITELMDGKTAHGEIITSCPVPMRDLPSPYTEAYYASFGAGRMGAIQNQLVYYESARGCPFSCTYCLSSSFQGVDELPISRVLVELDDLVAHGATCIKFVDRTFNANRKRAAEILRHILTMETTCTFHFEVAADLFDPELLTLISQMPTRRVQFEIGIQSTNDATLSEIDRKMQIEEVLQNIQTLVGFGNCHIHVDLIAGLPFETMESFAKGIDACISVRPHMLQLGFLKLLKGTKIRENRAEYGYVYNDFAPYEVFCSDGINFQEMIKLKEIEAVVDKFYNSGVFVNTINYAIDHGFGCAYPFFEALADCCKGKNLKVSPKQAYTILLHFLLQHMDKAQAEHVIKLDALTFHTKNVLPDEIAVNRDKRGEETFRRSVQPWYHNVRVEFFDYDRKTRVFVYDKKDEMQNAYQVIEL